MRPACSMQHESCEFAAWMLLQLSKLAFSDSACRSYFHAGFQDVCQLCQDLSWTFLDFHHYGDYGSIVSSLKSASVWSSQRANGAGVLTVVSRSHLQIKWGCESFLSHHVPTTTELLTLHPADAVSSVNWDVGVGRCVSSLSVRQNTERLWSLTTAGCRCRMALRWCEHYNQPNIKAKWECEWANNLQNYFTT